tara:strand:+ start:1640 stop:2545 length:906 start_codon:yes stop_codon:yes gene_type:complete
MADKTTLEQMLEHLVNDDAAKAEELFHEYVVSKSREIYEDLIEEEVKDDEEVDEASKDDDAEDKEVDEASKDDDAEDEKVDEASETDEEVDEEFEEVAVEADDEEEDPMDAMGGDKTDDLETDITGDSEDGDKEPEELFQDLDSIVDELQSKFDEIKGEEGDEMDMDAEKEEETFAPEASADPEGDAELATMREYVEKVAGGHGAESKGSADTADNKKSVVDNMKNDMGGTSANIVKGGEESGKNTGGLADITPKDMNTKNVNTPGSKNATKMSNEKGHGAEKKGAAENADNKQSIFRGRR